MLNPSKLQYLALFLLVTMLTTLVHRRVQKQRKRNRVIEDLHKSFSSLPPALTSPLDALSPNEPIPIFSGELLLISDSKTLCGSGNVSFSWLPNPRIVFRGDFSAASGVDIMENKTLSTSRHEPAEALITKANYKSSSSKTEVNGILNEPLRPQLPDGGFREIHFLLTNFKSYFGEPVRLCGKSLAMAKSRWRLNLDGYEISIDLTEKHKEVTDNVKSNGGFGITNIGRVSKNNRALLTMEEFEALSDSLRYFLGLCRGFWVGPVLPFADIDGKPHFVYAPSRLTTWQNAETWFPSLKPKEAGTAFNRFHQLLQDPDWGEGLRNATEWYVDANTADTLESAIVKTQVGLELLAWLVLVDRHEYKSNTKYRHDGAAMNLEDLLKVYRIPVDYPVHLEYLRRGTTAWNTDNGVHAIVKVRNHIVHSTSAKRKELASLGKMAKLEAKHLGLQYLELTLLAIIGYIGAYSDRTKFNRILGQEQVVPWGRTS
jgi:hypothetical protein